MGVFLFAEVCNLPHQCLSRLHTSAKKLHPPISLLLLEAVTYTNVSNNHLKPEADDHKEAQPAVQGVEVGDGRLLQVVGVEGCLEAHGGEDEGKHVHGGVEQLDDDLTVVAEHPVGQDAWGRNDK